MSNTINFKDSQSNRSAHTPGFELFTRIVDSGVLNWDKGFKRAIIDEIDSKTHDFVYQDGYYKILLEPFRRMSKFVYTIQDSIGDICKCHVQFLASKNHKIAQVVNYPKRIKTVMGEVLVEPLEKEVSVGTYCDNGKDEVVIINRFDAIGLPHCNDYSFYSPISRPLYEKYFSDRPDSTNPDYAGRNIDSLGRVEFLKKGGGTEYRYISETPHFHFQSVEQTQNFKNGQATSNAISITKLLDYLDDLEQGTEPLLYSESLGMPFLSFYNNERKYNSKMRQFLQNAHKILSLKAESEEQDIPGSSKDIADFMEGLINICDDGKTLQGSLLQPPPTNDPQDPFDIKNDVIDTSPEYISDIKDPGERNIACIKKDLAIAQAIIDTYPEEYELIASLSQTVSSAINNLGQEKEETKELEHER